MGNSLLSEKSLHFAADIVKLYRSLISEKKEYVVSKQLVRSGTSIGANTSEANYAQSRADFISKLQVALKETAETDYWLNLLKITDLVSDQTATELIEKCLDLKRMLVSSINTARNGQK
ncbi:MAG: four helix bundle protein [Clostridia bacterium]|nr:four helix bundle protein [Clostridia bacterium]